MYYIVIISSVIAYTISDLLFAHQTRKYSSFYVNILRSILLTLILSPLLFFADFSKISLHFLVLSFLFGISGAIYFLSSLTAYRFLPAWIATSIISLESLIVVFLGYYFYAEKFSYIWFVGIFLLIISTILLSLYKNDFKHLDSRWYLGIILAFIWTFSGALWWFGFSYIAKHTDIFLAWFLSQFSIFILLFPISFFLKNFYILENLKIFKHIALSSFTYAFATLAFFYSTIIWKISLSILFLSIIPILVSISAYFLFKEHLEKVQWLLIFTWFIWLILINL